MNPNSPTRPEKSTTNLNVAFFPWRKCELSFRTALGIITDIPHSVNLNLKVLMYDFQIKEYEMEETWVRQEI